MSKVFLEGQGSNIASYHHDCPPNYDSCQPSQDLLRFVIENEYSFRESYQQLDILNKKMDKYEKDVPRSADGNYILSSKILLDMSGFFAEASQVSTALANVLQERTVQNNLLHTAISRLTISEFDCVYASLKQDSTRQIRQKLAKEIETVKDVPEKPPRSFWKKIFMSLARA